MPSLPKPHFGKSPISGLYDQLAPAYERTRVPRFRPFVKRLLQFYDTRPGSHVLDAGCGTGLVATAVAPRAGHTGRVLGIDTSPAMLEIARQKAHGFGFTQCEFVLGDMAQVDAPDSSFDLVTCSFALWGDPDALFAEFYRLLKPNGALLIQNWEMERSGIPRTYSETLHTFSTKTPDERVRAVRESFSDQRELWSDLKTPADYERSLRRVGFSTVSAQWMVAAAQFKDLQELIEFHDLGVFASAEIAAMDESTLVAFHQFLRDALQPLVTDQGIHEEWRAIQVSARK